jgi:hypothetical protein
MNESRFKDPNLLVRLALYNARRMAKAEYKKRPNWVLAMELFICGSTMAARMCRDAEVDPDGTSAFQLWPYEPKPVGANLCGEIVLPVENGLAGPTDLAVAPVVGD